ncbi:MAG: glycosyltransferase family 1 protein [Candidatus Omnitrophota bacterium]|jgi:hypothetical protein|nr:MAG: glycosyltransferase family 1 protein [Candidatus Omnitrophota bacterium]
MFHNNMQKILCIDFYPGFPGGEIMKAILPHWQKRGVMTPLLQIEFTKLQVPQTAERFTRYLGEQLRRQKPDLLFCIQRDIRELTARAGISLGDTPTLTFITDAVARIDQLKQENDFIVAWSAQMGDYLKKNGYHNVIVLPMMADSFQKGNRVPQIQCEVSFFGNCWSGGSDQREAALQFFELRQPGLRRYTLELIDCFHQKTIEGNIYEVFETYPPPNGIIRVDPKSLFNFILNEATTRIRVETLERLSGHNLRVFGHGWEKTDASPQLRECFFPGLFIREQPHIFASSKINLNIANPAHWAAPTNRFFNIPASGELECCEWSDGMETFLRPDEEMCYFNGPDDIADRVSAILACREDYSAQIAAAQRQISERFNYAQWVEQLFKQWGER